MSQTIDPRQPHDAARRDAPNTRIVDLSQEIYSGMPVYQGHLKTVVWRQHAHDDTARLFDGGFSYTTMGLLMCDHGPTHVDALNHLDPDPEAQSIDRMDMRNFHGPGICLDVSDVAPRGYVTGEQLDAAAERSAVALEPDMVILLRTGSHDRWGDTAQYTTEYPGLDDSACAWLAEHEVRVFGVDAPSPDNPASRTYPAHMMCRERGVTHYENLAALEQLLDRRFTFYGMPLKIRGGTGSPVRAIAVLEDE